MFDLERPSTIKDLEKFRIAPNKFVEWVTLITLSLFISISVQSKALAFPNFDECGRFAELIAENRDELSLDELPMLPKRELGFSVRTDQKSQELHIAKIHPDFALELSEQELDVQIGDRIISINGEQVENLSEQIIDDALNSKSIQISTARGSTFETEQKDFFSFDLSISPTIFSLSSINSKSSEVTAKIQIHSFWYDERLAELGMQVHQEAIEVYPKAAESYFYCDFDKTFSANLVTPNFQVTNLLPSSPRKDVSFTIGYYPPVGCEGVETCTENEKKFGYVEFNKKETFSGDFEQEFNFVDFPFDTQSVNFTVVSSDEVFETEEYTHHTNLVFTEYSNATWEPSVQSISNNAWDVSNTHFSYLGQSNADVGLDIAALNFGLEAERKTTFYFFKIFLPISFILVISISSLWINPTELESRLTVSVVCLLSLIAYNYIIDQDIPKLGYLTFLDKLIFVAYFYSGLPTLQTVFVHHKKETDGTAESKSYDEIVRKLVPLSFILICVVIIGIHFLT